MTFTWRLHALRRRFVRVGGLHRLPTLRPRLIASNESFTLDASDRLKLIVVPVLTVLPDAFGSFDPLRKVVRESLSLDTLAVARRGRRSARPRRTASAGPRWRRRMRGVAPWR